MMTSRKPLGQRLFWVLFLAVAILCGPSRGTIRACVGLDCLQVRSTEPDGGALVVEHDFDRKIQTFEVFCTADRAQCLYSTIDPGFRAEPGDVPGLVYFPLAAGTRVRVEIVEADPPVSVSVNGQKLRRPGESASVGVAPEVHTHPAWQLQLPGGEVGDYQISYKLTTDSPSYAESDVFTSVVTNVEPPPGTPTPTPQPTPTPAPCVGDCDADGRVSVDELVVGTAITLGRLFMDECSSFDRNRDDSLSIDELVRGVAASLHGCMGSTPALLADVQQMVFTPHCAIPACHDAQSATANLDLTEEAAADQLLDVSPSTEAAAIAGLLRVAPGRPNDSFLLVKLEGPPPGQGGRMPLGLPALTATQIRLISDWILQGARE